MGSFLRSISDTTRHVNHPQKVVFCISPPLLGGYGINRTLSIGCNKSIATCTFLPSGACVWIIWRWWITFPLLWCECHYLDMLNTSSLERIIPSRFDEFFDQWRLCACQRSQRTFRPCVHAWFGLVGWKETSKFFENEFIWMLFGILFLFICLSFRAWADTK